VLVRSVGLQLKRHSFERRESFQWLANIPKMFLLFILEF